MRGNNCSAFGDLGDIFAGFIPEHRALMKLPGYRHPLTEWRETDKEMIASLEMPGVGKEDIKLNVTAEGIEVRAEKRREFEAEDKKTGAYRMEKSYAGFFRLLALPEGVDPKEIQASHANGVLVLRFPKPKEKKGLEIQVK